MLIIYENNGKNKQKLYQNEQCHRFTDLLLKYNLTDLFINEM